MYKKESAATAIFVYCIASIMMTLANKLILSAYQFPLVFLVLAIQVNKLVEDIAQTDVLSEQNLSTVLMLQFAARFGFFNLKKLSIQNALVWWPIAFALVLMMYTGGQALRLMAVSLFQVYKNLTIILIAYGELLFFQGEAVSSTILASFALLIGGSLMAGWPDIVDGKALSGEGTVLATYFWMTLNCIATAFFSLYLRAKIRAVSFRDLDTVYYNNLLSVPFLLLGCVVFEISAMQASWARFVNPGQDRGELAGLVLAIFISSISAFGISLGTSMCVRLTSSTTYSMVGALNKLPLSVSGMFFFADPITVGSVGGVLLAFFGGVLYTHAKNEQIREKAADASKQTRGYVAVPVENTESDNKKPKVEKTCSMDTIYAEDDK